MIQVLAKLTFFVSLLFVSCSKSSMNKDLPSCINGRINEFDRANSCNSASVKEYKFQGAEVFSFDPGTCGADMTIEILDDNCKTLGHLGGISGNTSINGEDFSNATYIKTIWEK